MHSNHHYNKQLRPFAWENRNNMNKAEAWMWKFVLGRRQMMGFRFRRQRPIDQYIVDFACLQLKLIVEVDGFTHLIPEVAMRDQVRQARLESHGYMVIRFTNQEIYHNLDLVRNKVEQVVSILAEGK